MFNPLPEIEVYEIGKYVNIKLVGLCCVYWIARREGLIGEKTYSKNCPDCGEPLDDKKLKENYHE